MTTFTPHTIPVSDDAIVSFCDTPDQSALDKNHRVLRLSLELVVKFGMNVSKEEARNQSTANHLLNSHVRIPTVYRFFERQRYIAPEYCNNKAIHNGYCITIGYLVMEYMEGESFPPAQHPQLVSKMLEAIGKMQNNESDTPGPVDSGPSKGISWEDDYPAFQTKAQLEDWINRRLLPNDPQVSFSGSPLVFSHLDITPRNVLQIRDGSICLLDWSSAGFYPRVFELAVLKLRPLDTAETVFNNMLVQGLVLSRKEEEELDIIVKSWRNSQIFAFLLTAISNRPQSVLPFPTRRKRRDITFKAGSFGSK